MAGHRAAGQFRGQRVAADSDGGCRAARAGEPDRGDWALAVAAGVVGCRGAGGGGRGWCLGRRCFRLRGKRTRPGPNFNFWPPARWRAATCKWRRRSRDEEDVDRPGGPDAFRHGDFPTAWPTGAFAARRERAGGGPERHGVAQARIEVDGRAERRDREAEQGISREGRALLRNALRRAVHALSEELAKPQVDLARANACVDRMAAAQSESERATLDHILRVRAVLTPDQQQRYAALVSQQVCAGVPLGMHHPAP